MHFQTQEMAKPGEVLDCSFQVSGRVLDLYILFIYIYIGKILYIYIVSFLLCNDVSSFEFIKTVASYICATDWAVSSC